MKICETFSSSSLKEDLSIDTTFDPCYFSWDSPSKGTFGWKLRGNKLYITWKFFLKAIEATPKSIILLKGHFAIFKKFSLILVRQLNRNPSISYSEKNLCSGENISWKRNNYMTKYHRIGAVPWQILCYQVCKSFVQRLFITMMIALA